MTKSQHDRTKNIGSDPLRYTLPLKQQLQNVNTTLTTTETKRLIKLEAYYENRANSHQYKELNSSTTNNLN